MSTCVKFTDFPNSLAQCGQPVTYRVVLECPACGDLSPEWDSCTEHAAAARRGDGVTRHGGCGVQVLVSSMVTA